MRRDGQYNLEDRRKQFKVFEKRVKRIMQLRAEGKTFQAIANTIGLSTRQQAHYIYQDNKLDALPQ